MAKITWQRKRKRKRRITMMTIRKDKQKVILLLLKLKDDKIVFIGDSEHSNLLLNSES